MNPECISAAAQRACSWLGVGAGDRKLGLMGEVARGRYSHFTDAEMAAIHAYLTEVALRDP